MSAQHTPGTERLTPVCEASGRSLQAYLNSANKDATGRAPCPICRKVVKLRKGAGERWANTIPHHHMGRLAGAAFAEASAKSNVATDADWSDPLPYDPVTGLRRAAIAKATGSAA